MDNDCSELVIDAIRFVRSSFSAIEDTPLQVYSSALAFSPRNSAVRKLFSSCIPAWLSLCPQVDDEWSACLSTLEGHNESVLCVAFSHDSKLLASGSWDGTIRLWETDTDHCKAVLQIGKRVHSLAFSHDSRILASASSHSIHLWDVQMGQCISEFENPGGEHIRSVFFSSDSKTLLSGSDDATIRLWDAQSGKCNMVLEDHGHRVERAIFSPDNRKILSASYDKTARLWDADSGKCLLVLEGHRERVNCVAFSRDTTTLATVSCDSTVRCWDANSGECRQTFRELKSEIRSVAFLSFSDKNLIFASSNGWVCLWDVDSGELVSDFPAHGDIIQALVVSPDSRLLASCSNDCTVQVWDTTALLHQGPRRGHDRKVTSLAFSHDLRLLASSSEDHTVGVWDTETGRQRPSLLGHCRAVELVSFSRDSTRLMSSARDVTSRLWDTRSGVCVEHLDKNGDMTSVLFSPNSTTMATTHYQDQDMVRLWDAATGQHIMPLPFGGCLWVSSMDYSCDSCLLAVGGGDGTVLIWNVAAGTCQQALEDHEDEVQALAFSPSVARAAVLASGSRDLTIRVWDAGTGHCHAVLSGHRSSITSLAFSSDARRLGSGSPDKEVRIWDTDTKSCLITMRASDFLIEMKFTPDDKGIVTRYGSYPLPSVTESTAGPVEVSCQETGISFRGESWLALDGKDWLWLPAQCRNGVKRLQGDKVAVGCQTGEVVLLGLRATGQI